MFSQSTDQLELSINVLLEDLLVVDESFLPIAAMSIVQEKRIINQSAISEVFAVEFDSSASINQSATLNWKVRILFLLRCSTYTFFLWELTMHYATEDYHEEHHRHGGGCHHHSHHRNHHDHDSVDENEALYEYYGELEQKEGLKLLMDVLEKLQANGVVKLSDHQVSITDEVGFSITHEETWDDTEKLTLEIEWYPVEDETSVAEEEGEDASQAPPVVS